VKNLHQNDSKYLDWTNGTGSDVSSGDMVHIGNGQVAMAKDDIADGETGVLIRSNAIIKQVPKVAGSAIEAGAKPKVGTAGNTVDGSTSTALTTIVNAFVYPAAESADTTCYLVLE
jgi:predicted RecA/RadA family phage recombinase